MQPIYLDHNATTPLDPDVLEHMLPYLKETFGNASSIHHFGFAAKKGVDEARAIVAEQLGCEAEEVVFTSGATESDNHVLRGVFEAKKGKGNHLIVSAIEHPAVMTTAQRLEKLGAEVTYLGVNEDGIVDPEAVRDAIRDDTILVSIMAANNEVGSVQPIAAIGEIVREKGVMFHSDAVQAAGKLPLKVDDLNVNFMSLSGHKIYGPKGIGVLYIRRGSFIRPLITGGHHEFNRRAGTENVAGMVGFGRAFQLAHERMKQDNERIGALRDHLQKRLLESIPHLYVTAANAERLPTTLHVLFHFVEGEGILMKMSINHGIAVSTGSACTSGTLSPSHVLDALGISKQLANSGIRISLGRGNTREEMDRVAEAFVQEVAQLKQMSPLFDSYAGGRMKPEEKHQYDKHMTVR